MASEPIKTEEETTTPVKELSFQQRLKAAMTSTLLEISDRAWYFEERPTWLAEGEDQRYGFGFELPLEDRPPEEQERLELLHIEQCQQVLINSLSFGKHIVFLLEVTETEPSTWSITHYANPIDDGLPLAMKISDSLVRLASTSFARFKMESASSAIEQLLKFERNEILCPSVIAEPSEADLESFFNTFTASLNTFFEGKGKQIVWNVMTHFTQNLDGTTSDYKVSFKSAPYPTASPILE
jgi:hypothetical protein